MFFEMGASRNRLAFYNIAAGRRGARLRKKGAQATNGESYNSESELIPFEGELAMAA